MSRHTHAWILILLAAGVVAASSPGTRAAEEVWEELPNGVLGQLAMFDGADGVKIAGYVRKPPRGVVVMVTHNVNIAALTRHSVDPAELVLVKPDGCCSARPMQRFHL